ncbi:MAG TPA: 2-dehydropantoate 2-reductase [Streptosporangiaceae bacterium]|nr:2-dehydropantoate 2-reductase [Streptosporangiaceae bacterium]
MRICVLGAGAIGGFLGTRLAVAGFETSALARGATLAALRTHGWRAETSEGRISAPVRAAADPADLGPQDVVVFAVKATSAASAVASIGPLLGPDTMVLTAMNGVPWWFFEGFGGACEGHHLTSVDPAGRIAAAVPVHRVIGGVLHMSCATVEPGLVRHHQGTGLIIGEPGHHDSPRVRDLAEVFLAAGLDVTVSTEIRKAIWYKLWGNLTINPVSALTGATADLILDEDLVRTFCQTAMTEAQEVGARIGLPIAERPEDRNKVTRKLGAFKSSMLQDAEAGRPLELDALAGAVAEIGALVGVATPTVNALLGLTRLSAQVRSLG